VDAPATMTVDGVAQREMNGRLVNLSVTGMRVVVDAHVRPGEAVHIAVNGTRFAGTACYCKRTLSSYAVGVRLDQSFTVSDELLALMRKLVGVESVAQPSP
jgi:hypothetical protein